MRDVDRVELPEDLSVERDLIGFADWRENPHDVLEHVDVLLKPHGLEIVILMQGDDSYYWRIEPRE